MQDAYMTKDAAVTVRLPGELKRQLQARAKQHRRSLSAQLAFDLSRALADDPPTTAPGKFLGMFSGARLPSDDDLAEVRRLLWGRLARRGRCG